MSNSLPTNDKLSTNFFYSELIRSETAESKGLDNSPPPHVYTVAIQTALRMEDVRKILGTPITINSWYRSPEVNAAVGGAKTSQHLLGEAVDFVSPRFGTPQEICTKLAAYANHLNFDQLIFEHSWVHISFTIASKRVPRRQVLTLLRGGKYAKGITDKQGNPL